MSDHALEETHNYFSILGIEEGYTISCDDLEKSYISLQRETHPDRFAGDPAKQAIAFRYASFINEAYETLKSPLRRARYLLTLAGVETDFEHSMVDDKVFLMDQMELRERLADIESESAPERALNGMLLDIRETIMALERLFDSKWRLNEEKKVLVDIVQKMYFTHKLLQEVKNKAELLAGN